MGCRPVVHEGGDSKEEEDADEEMEWRLLKALEEKEEEERRAMGVGAEFRNSDKKVSRKGM